MVRTSGHSRLLSGGGGFKDLGVVKSKNSFILAEGTTFRQFASRADKGATLNVLSMKSRIAV